MKKCNRYLEAIENNSDQDKSLWQDILMHASRCPDCGADMKLRSEMLEIIAELPEPEYPDNLHEAIMKEISAPALKNTEDQSSRWQNFFLEGILRPFELVLPVACLIMFVFLIQLESQNDSSAHLSFKPAATQASAKKEADAMKAKIDNDQLEKVSEEEVDLFLQQLAEFRKNHPESVEPIKNPMPEVRLVNDQMWRTP